MTIKHTSAGETIAAMQDRIEDLIAENTELRKIISETRNTMQARIDRLVEEKDRLVAKITALRRDGGELLTEEQARIGRLRAEIMTMHCGTPEGIARWIVENRQDIAGDVAMALMRHFVLQRTRARSIAAIVAQDDFMVEN
jgi:hypothetical protein